MAELLPKGYVDLREHVMETYKYIQFRDGSGTKIHEFERTNDTIAKWTHVSGTQEVLGGYDEDGKPYFITVPYQDNPTLELTITFKGTTVPNLALPRTFASVAIYTDSTDAYPREPVMVETLYDPNTNTPAPFVMQYPEDVLKMIMKIQIPLVVA